MLIVNCFRCVEFEYAVVVMIRTTGCACKRFCSSIQICMSTIVILTNVKEVLEYHTETLRESAAGDN
jgi:hypothetical protein